MEEYGQIPKGEWGYTFYSGLVNCCKSDRTVLQSAERQRGKAPGGRLGIVSRQIDRGQHKQAESEKPLQKKSGNASIGRKEENDAHFL